MPWTIVPMVVACVALEAEKARLERANLKKKMWSDIDKEFDEIRYGTANKARYSCINCGAPFNGESTCSYCKTER